LHAEEHEMEDRGIAGDTAPRPFRYRNLGAMATVSRFRALAVIGDLRIRAERTQEARQPQADRCDQHQRTIPISIATVLIATRCRRMEKLA
jgi:hypothetical protein